MSLPNEAESATLAAQVADLRAEGAELHSLIETLRPEDWQRVTAFRDWTVFDVIAHLHLSDRMGMCSLEGPASFHALLQDMAAAGLPMSGYARRWLGEVDGATLGGRWYRLLQQLCDGLAQCDPAERLSWVGPGMKPRMFATARQMETWAHGWELYDLLGVPRTQHERLRNIATIGVRTYGWTFANRKLAPPGAAPRVELRAPAGGSWIWNAASTGSSVRGDAVEFCQVVTQVRHVADTRLEVQGESARRWMAIAQCFAGPPADPPAPGSRAPRQAPDEPGPG